MIQLYRNDRAIGREVARVRIPNGTELVVLQTALCKQEVAPIEVLRPVSESQVRYEITRQLAELIDHARFLGIDEETFQGLFERALCSGGMH